MVYTYPPKTKWVKLTDEKLIQEAKEKEKALLAAGKTPVTAKEIEKLEEYKKLINKTRSIIKHNQLRSDRFMDEVETGGKSEEEIRAYMVEMENDQKQVTELFKRLEEIKKELG